MVGLFGFLLDINTSKFKSLTPLNLVLTTLAIFLINGKFSLKLLVASFIIFSLGLSIEIIGVETGLLFGEYNYGETLGYKFKGVPLTIGLNWLFLSLATFSIAKSLFKKSVFAVIFASLLMVFLDYFVEPVAINLDFWNWESVNIPIQNYIMWFLASIFMQAILHLFNIKFSTKAGCVIYSLQLIFFIVLNLNL